MVERLKPLTERAFTVMPPDNPRSLDAASYAEVYVRNGIDVTPFDNLHDAVRAAIRDCRENGLPLICMGSLYLYRPLTDEISAALAE